MQCMEQLFKVIMLMVPRLEAEEASLGNCGLNSGSIWNFNFCDIVLTEIPIVLLFYKQVSVSIMKC